MERSCEKLFWNEVSISTENQTVRRFYKKLRKENAEKDSDVYFGNENSFEEQNVATTEGNTEKQTKGHDENIAEFECKGINKKQETGTILNLFLKNKKELPAQLRKNRQLKFILKTLQILQVLYVPRQQSKLVKKYYQ